MTPLAIVGHDGSLRRALAYADQGRVFAFDPNQPRDPLGSKTGGRWAPKDVADLTPMELWRDGQEYEGRLFGGAYDNSRIVGRMVAKDAPMRAAIMQARERYTEIRQRLNLEPVQDWAVRPSREQLVQSQPRPEVKQHAQHDYAALGKRLDALEAKGIDALQGALTECRDALVSKVRKAADFAALVNDLKRLPRFGAVEVEVRAMLDRAWEAGSRDAGAEMKAEMTVKKFDGSSFSPRAATRWLRATAFWVAGILGDRVLADVKGIILNGLKTGTAGSVMAEQILDAFLPWLGDADVIRDEQQLQPWRLETIVRTNTTTAYNHGRLTEFVDPEVLRFVKGIRYSAILDERTTEVCRFLDGKVFKPTDPDLEALLPPNHYNCRSIIVPIVAGEQLNEADLITPGQVGRARELADVKFLTQTSAAWGAYRDRGQFVGLEEAA